MATPNSAKTQMYLPPLTTAPSARSRIGRDKTTSVARDSATAERAKAEPDQQTNRNRDDQHG